MAVSQPFFWFMLSIALWAVIGYMVNYTLESMSDGESYLDIAMNVNIRVNMDNLATYLHVVELLDEEFFFEEGQHTYRRVRWVETNMLKWEGEPPRVEMVVDWTYGWMLRVMIQYRKSQGKMNRKEIKQIFFDELMEAPLLPYMDV